MKKKCNVIQINGFTGIALVVFAICCAVTGFIVFPSWCCMHIWNFVATNINFPLMNIYHGGMLWVILVLVFIATHLNKLPVRIGSFSTIDRDEMKRKLEKLQANNIAAFTAQEEEKNDNQNS